MSWQAQEAVQDHSRYQSPEYYYEFRILLAIARFADAHGVAGVPGRHKECPSHNAIAQKAQVHPNTVAKYLPILIEDGELALEAQGGAGRGSWTVYRINLPLPVTPHETPHATGETVGQSHVALLAEMAHDIKRMAHELAHVKALMPHENATNATRLQRERVDDPLDPGDPDPDPEDDDARAHAEAATLELLDFWQDLTGSFGPSDPERRARDYLGPLNGLWRRTGRDVDEACRLLEEKRQEMLDQGKTPYRPAAVVPHIFADLDGVQPRASPNGAGTPELDWEPLDEQGATY